MKSNFLSKNVLNVELNFYYLQCCNNKSYFIARIYSFSSIYYTYIHLHQYLFSFSFFCVYILYKFESEKLIKK